MFRLPGAFYSVIWLSLYIVINPSTSKLVQLKTQIKTAQCRANCLEQFENNTRLIQSCRGTPDCNMCWETCELLHRNFGVWGTMCGVSDICFLGCDKACEFYLEGHRRNFIANSSRTRSSLSPLRLEFETKNKSIKFTWSAPVSRRRSNPECIVYVVLVKRNLTKNDELWEEVTQTLKKTTNIKASWLNRPSEVKIVAVTSEGVFGKQTVLYSPNIDSNAARDKTSEVATSNVPTAVVDEKNIPWRPTLFSLSYDDNFLNVEAIITWPALRPTETTKYEVTWKVFDGLIEITGHLYTADNVVKLTLWPETLYTVQVKDYTATNEHEPLSENLTVDTHGIAPVTTSISHKCLGCLRVEVIAGCAACFSSVLAVLMTCCLCKKTYRKKRQHQPIRRMPVILRKNIEESRDYLQGGSFVYSSPQKTDIHMVSFGARPLSPIYESEKEFIYDSELPNNYSIFDIPSSLQNHPWKAAITDD